MTIIAIVSLVYSVASSIDSMRRQKHMQRDAEKRADEAKGFQVVVEAEIKSLCLQFGRGLVGGVRVHHYLSSDYIYKPPAEGGKVFVCNYKDANAAPDSYQYVNEKADWSGKWSIVPMTIPWDLMFNGTTYLIVPDSKDATQGRLPGPGWVLTRGAAAWVAASKKGYGASSTGAPIYTGYGDSEFYFAPRTDFIFAPYLCKGMKTARVWVQTGVSSSGSSQGYYKDEQVADYDTTNPPPVPTDFPVYLPGQTDSTSASVSETKREFMYIQQALCVSGLHDIVSFDVDSKEYNNNEYKHGLRIHVYKDGGAVDPLMAANDATRVNARFTDTAYFTGVFRLDRDNPQFSAIPTVQSYVEGLELPYVIRSGSEGTYTYSLSAEKTYSNNPARVMLYYLMSPYGKNLPITSINLPSMYNSQQLCDRLVKKGIATGGRFWAAKGVTSRDISLCECNVQLDTGKAVRSNVETILETMGDANLVWSGGQYKLSLMYPLVWDKLYSDINNKPGYAKDDVVQVAYDGWSKTLLRSLCDANTAEPSVDNVMEHGAQYDSSKHKWADDVIAAVITDDYIRSLSADAITINWPDVETKLNFATVRFTNEEKNFVEDSVSWPCKTSTDYNAAGKNLYMQMLEEDNYLALEAETFESGILDSVHALAKAEQRVRASRAAVTYGLELDIRMFRLEPGDPILLQSDVLGIPGILLKVTEAVPKQGGKVSLSATVFDASILAWNADDTKLIDSSPVYNNAIGQATGLAINANTTDNKVSGYRLSWKASADPRVTQYVVMYTTELPNNITSDTAWTVWETTPNLFSDLPALTGHFSFTVVSQLANGRKSPYVDHENGTQWPILGWGLTTDYLNLGASYSLKISGRNILKTKGDGSSDITLLVAKLMANDTESTAALTYKWFDTTVTPMTQLTTDISGYKGMYGFRASDNTVAAPSAADLGVNVPTTADYSAFGKGLVVTQDAISGANEFMVEVYDAAASQTYRAYVSVSDTSDPYQVAVLASGSTVFKNGQGTVEIYPAVYYGEDPLSVYNDWTFQYILERADGSRAGFIDPARAGGTSGIPVNSNSAYTSGAFTLSVTPNTVAVNAGDLIKLANEDTSNYFRVSAASSGSLLTLTSDAVFPADNVKLNDFAGHSLFVCVGNGVDAGTILKSNCGADGYSYRISVTAADVDVASTIRVAASNALKHFNVSGNIT